MTTRPLVPGYVRRDPRPTHPEVDPMTARHILTPLDRVMRERDGARERAAEVLWESVDGKGIKGRLFREDCDYLADALIANALLVTNEQREVHDALRAHTEARIAERERDEARAALARVREVHERYFDTDRKPGSWDDHLGTGLR